MKKIITAFRLLKTLEDLGITTFDGAAEVLNEGELHQIKMLWHYNRDPNSKLVQDWLNS